MTAPESTALVTAGPDAGVVWHYGNPVAEQRSLAAGTAVVDFGPSREVFTITGPDRLTWLHSLTSQHLNAQPDGEPFTALVLSPTGHIEQVLNGVDDADAATTWVWTEPERGAGLVEWLERMRFMTRVEVARRLDLRVLWVGDLVTGTDAATAVRRSSLGGRELFWPADLAAPGADDGATPVGIWAAEAARIAAGQPRVWSDTDHRTIPNEIGLWGTHLDKGCYRGQETVARVHTLGRPPRRLVQLLLDGSADALPELGSPVTVEERAVGFVGTSARHHELGPIALALVKRSVPVESTLTVHSAQGEPITASQQVLVDPEVGLHIRPRL